MKHSEITGQYRLILDKLMEKRDLETVLFLRIMMETGLRSREVYALKPEYIRNRQIDLPHRFQKNNGKDEAFAEIPCISRKTERIAELVAGNRGRYFTKSRNHYLMRIKRVRTDPRFSALILRDFRRKIIWWIYMDNRNR